jgi:hypothetical protein
VPPFVWVCPRRSASSSSVAPSPHLTASFEFESSLRFGISPIFSILGFHFQEAAISNVDNFRSGWIAAFNGFTYKFMGFVRAPDDSILTIEGLWSLTFANDGTAGLANTLYFTAGINGEQDGLFGGITPVDGLDGDEE